MKAEQIREVVRAHILETCPPEKRDMEITAGSSLVGTGILDSVGVFVLVAFLEERYRIQVGDEDLVWKNFETVDGIANLVESKLSGVEVDLI